MRARLPRPWMVLLLVPVAGLLLVAAPAGSGPAPCPGEREEASPAKPEEASSVKGWKKGRGWGWVWGKDDQVGSLNAMTDATRAEALRLATRGEVFDLGLTYS